MKLCAVNGSPKGARSNTKKFMDRICEGFEQTQGNSCEEYFLIRENGKSPATETIQSADILLVGFPLYMTAMPGIVKAFIERMPESGEPRKKLCFFAQCGFPESYQIEPMECYFPKLARRLGYEYLGTLFKGFGSSLEIMPPAVNRKTLDAFYELGKKLGETGKLDGVVLRELKRPERLTGMGLFSYRLLGALGMLDSYTRMQLKKNGLASRDAFARPLL